MVVIKGPAKGRETINGVEVWGFTGFVVRMETSFVGYCMHRFGKERRPGVVGNTSRVW